METSSLLSSLHDECRLDSYLEPHYKEWYRIAIDALIEGGIEAYQEFLAKERCSEFLADDEIRHILNTVQKIPQNTFYAPDNTSDDASSSGTYWPMESDVEAPNLDLGWPYVMPGISGGTNIELLFHPPRVQPYTIKETIRKMIKEARKESSMQRSHEECMLNEVLLLDSLPAYPCPICSKSSPPTSRQHALHGEPLVLGSVLLLVLILYVFYKHG